MAIIFQSSLTEEGVRLGPQLFAEFCARPGNRDGNDHEVDQKLATNCFAELPTKLPTMATMIEAMSEKLRQWSQSPNNVTIGHFLVNSH